MPILTRRNLLKTIGVLGVGTAAGAGSFAVWRNRGQNAYRQAVDEFFRPADLTLSDNAKIMREIARFATMAPNSHNTQPWLFELYDSTMTIRADESRRCPAVDPDDHHVFVTLGCAVENATHTARAFGMETSYAFDEPNSAVRLEFSPLTTGGRDQPNPLFDAIPLRQSTRAAFDGQPLTNEELDLLKQAGSSDNVNLTLLTDEKQIESVMELVLEGNRQQMLDPEFVAELKHWIRFSYFEAVKRGDGLFTLTTGNPALPEWAGGSMFDMAYSVESETTKYTQQCRTSAGIAIFTGKDQSQATWVEVGKCFERFALKATSMNVLHSHINQPVEVTVLRSQLADLLGEKEKLPDLVIRFGHGKSLPKSLRRPLDEVISWKS